MSVVKNFFLKRILFSTGVVSVLLGLAGVVLPLLPATPFALLAAWCFYKSSPKAHHWLLRQPGLGPAILDWEKHRAVSRKTKGIALVLIAVSMTVTWVKVDILWLKSSVAVFLFFVSVFLLTRNSKNT